MRVRSFYLIINLMLVQSTVLASNIEDLSGIQSQALSYLSAHYDDMLRENSELSISVNSLDSRLRLAQCDNPLTFEVKDNGSAGGRVSVKTRCDSTVQWTIYVQAVVAINEPIVVAAQNIQKGTIIGPEHLEEIQLNVAELSAGFVSSREELIGKSASRTLLMGKPIRSSYIKDPLVIERGDLVVIEAQLGPLMVSSQGTAMNDGAIGENISVRNDQSKEVISGEVVSSGRIRVAAY